MPEQAPDHQAPRHLDFASFYAAWLREQTAQQEEKQSLQGNTALEALRDALKQSDETLARINARQQQEQQDEQLRALQEKVKNTPPAAWRRISLDELTAMLGPDLSASATPVSSKDTLIAALYQMSLAEVGDLFIDLAEPLHQRSGIHLRYAGELLVEAGRQLIKGQAALESALKESGG